MRTAHLLALSLVSTPLGAFADAPAKPKPDAPAATKPAAKPAAPADKPAAAPVAGPARDTATAELKNAKGEKVGEAQLEETPRGVLITVELTGVPAGAHAFHIHGAGKCDPAPGDKGPFTSAGGHFNPGAHKHGLRAAEGAHEGDLPNVTVGADGKGRAQVLAAWATLKKGEKASLLKDGGTALVVHAKEDDHMSDPAGAAGDRIACGTIVAGAAGASR